MNDVRHQISVDPMDYLGIHISKLKKDWHVGGPRTSLKKITSTIHHSLDLTGRPIFGRCLTIPVMPVLTDRNRAFPPSLIGTGAERSIEEVKRGLFVFASS